MPEMAYLPQNAGQVAPIPGVAAGSVGPTAQLGVRPAAPKELSTGPPAPTGPILHPRVMAIGGAGAGRRWRTSRSHRAKVGAELAVLHSGVVHRRDLRAEGISRHEVQSEIQAGRWMSAGRHTVVVGTGALTPEALRWRAVWESGSGAVLDGVGHQRRRASSSPRGGDRARGVVGSIVGPVIRDVCDGAHSLGELDFAGYCRQYGLPEPTRQSVRSSADGRVYLDVGWEDVGLVVEIDGGHHALALSRSTTPCVRTPSCSVANPCCGSRS